MDRAHGGFEQAVMPHLDAAYNLARWLTRRDHDAEDVVQEAYLRAFKAFDQYHGRAIGGGRGGDSGDARCWLLAIVRNTCFTWLERNRRLESKVNFDESTHVAGCDAFDPHLLLEASDDRDRVRRAVEELPVEFREVVILREFEGLSYQQIAVVAELPVGTVMSRLARARDRLHKTLSPTIEGGVT